MDPLESHDPAEIIPIEEASAGAQATRRFPPVPVVALRGEGGGTGSETAVTRLTSTLLIRVHGKFWPRTIFVGPPIALFPDYVLRIFIVT
jgi:hypothetical protein